MRLLEIWPEPTSLPPLVFKFSSNKLLTLRIRLLLLLHSFKLKNLLSSDSLIILPLTPLHQLHSERTQFNQMQLLLPSEKTPYSQMQQEQ
jgi:hypothetical protein